MEGGADPNNVTATATTNTAPAAQTKPKKIPLVVCKRCPKEKRPNRAGGVVYIQAEPVKIRQGRRSTKCSVCQTKAVDATSGMCYMCNRVQVWMDLDVTWLMHFTVILSVAAVFYLRCVVSLTCCLPATDRFCNPVWIASNVSNAHPKCPYWAPKQKTSSVTLRLAMSALRAISWSKYVASLPPLLCCLTDC